MLIPTVGDSLVPEDLCKGDCFLEAGVIDIEALLYVLKLNISSREGNSKISVIVVPHYRKFVAYSIKTEDGGNTLPGKLYLLIDKQEVSNLVCHVMP